MTHPAPESQEGMAADRDETASRDWSPQTEMARLLELCEAQMDAAIRDSDQAVDALVKAFTDLVSTARSLNDVSKELSTKHQGLAQAIDQRTQTITGQVGEAVVAFQFYDKLSQRLGHVRYSLSTLAPFICKETSGEPEQWQKLIQTLRRLYRTQEERAVFDAVTEGKPLPDASAAPAQGAVHVDTAVGAIELF